VPRIPSASRALTALAVAALVAGPLVACSSPAAIACPVTPSGDGQSKVTITGDAGVEPTVSIPSPFDVTETQRFVVTEGKGEVVEPGLYVTTHYVLYDAATGEKVDGSKDFGSDDGLSFVATEGKILSGILKTVRCSTVGSRVVGIVPPADGFGEYGPQFGIGATDTLVFVFDITDVGPAPSDSPTPSATPEPLPTPAEWTTDVPKVDLSGDVPVVTLPDVDPPTELLTKVLEAGDGEVVTEASTVTLDYQLSYWSTGTVDQQTFGTDEPLTGAATGFVPGFSAAIIGQKVGTTLLIAIPPAYGYGEGATSAGSPVGQTLVFVVRILSVG
jgi:peptidylprolyl isomerase